MKITIDIGQQAAEWLFWRALELGPLTKIETLAASLVEKGVEQAIYQRKLEQQLEQQQALQDKQGQE